MNVQHTPGPWKAARNKSYWEVVVPWPEQTLDEADEYSPSVAYAWGGTEQQAEANASLIAAAPDLLVALQALFALPEYDGTKVTSLHRISVKEKVRAAISKATGGQP